MNDKIVSYRQAQKQLLVFFRRNGYIRSVDEKRKKEQGQNYKKGYEVRLVANSKEELGVMRQLLLQVGFNPGKPYIKHAQFIQPVYGKFAVDWFVSRE